MSQEKKDLDQTIDLKLTAEQLDILKELGNIGSGNAISALSNLLNDKIEVSLTAVNIIPFWKIPELFKTPFSEVFGIFSEIVGYSDFSIIQIFTKKSIINLINVLNENDNLIAANINKINDLDEFSYSIVSEIGNLLAGHYANALADLLSIKLLPHVPKIALDSLNAMLNSTIAKYSRYSDFLIFIKTQLSMKEINIKGTICFIPSAEVLNRLFKVLEVKYFSNK